MRKHYLLPFFIIVLSLLNPFKTKAQAVNVQDSLALVDLYNSTGGTGWFNHTNWLTRLSVSKWYGITVTNNRVTQVSSIGNGMTGIVPSSIGNLTSLNTLAINGNYISGTIPVSLGNLVNLTSLDLSSNQFSGAIPSILGNLINLTFLSLNYNTLSDSIPSSIGNLSKLTKLFLTSNRLSGSIPPSFGNLSKLFFLALNVNLLTGNIPASLGNLPNIIALDFSSNKLSGAIPSSIGNLSSLQSLTLSNNQLTDSIPSSMGNMGYLTYLHLESNLLSGSIPSSLQKLTGLNYLNLSNNLLSGTIAISLQSLNFLDKLNPSFLLNNNHLSFAGMEGIVQSYTSTMLNYSPQANIPIQQNGNILYVSAGGTLANNTYKWYHGPTLVSTKTGDSTFAMPTIDGNYSVVVTNSIATQLTLYSNTSSVQDSLALVDLYNSTNGMSWAAFSSWLTKQPLSQWNGVTVANGRVIGLNLFNKGLNGTIPISLGNLSNLVNLNLSYNRLKDSIPSSLGNLYSLTNLNLNNNTLKNSIPASLGNLSGLTSLDLSYNQLNSSIPSSLGNLFNLTQLFLSYNQLGDTISSSLGNLTKLNYLGLNNNQLTGNIPSSIGNLSNLSNLIMSSNQLNGNIPSSLGNLISLTNMTLYGNQLNGSLPSSLGNLANLQVFELLENHLTGSIPPSFGNLAKLVTLNLSDNYLTGNIPLVLGNLPNLTKLDLSINKLSGAIPSSLGNDTKLKYLLLYLNQLSDSIPYSLGNLTNLYDFELDSNHLTGNIPSSLGNLSNLYYLSMSYNQLSGSIPSSFGNLLKLEYLVLPFNQLSGEIPASLKSLPSIGTYDTSLYLFNNRFTFSGMEGIAQAYPSKTLAYAPQAPIPIQQNGNILSVSVGGTPNNNTYKWYRNSRLVTTTVADSTFTLTSSDMNDAYSVTVTNTIATALILQSNLDTFTFNRNILPAKPKVVLANLEYTDTEGWTHYYFDNNTPHNVIDDTLLLSIKKNGQNIGTIGDGTFAVKLVATANAGSNTGLLLTNPLITNTSGYWVMNRFWQVTPTQQPATSVGVRFYYNNQDVADVNGSYPTHNLAKDKLIFYKATGGNPDPTTNLAGATKLTGILPNTYSSDTTWTYHILSDTTQYAEYSVASFSGGGGGATGNGQSIAKNAIVLPVTLISFTAHANNNIVTLNWQTSIELNASHFNIQRSADGVNFTNIGKVAASGSNTGLHNYTFSDPLFTQSPTLYYRLQAVDKDGSFAYTDIVAIRLDGKSGLVIFPNPVKDILYVQVQSNITEKAMLTLTDLQGRVLQQQQILLTNGTNSFTTNAATLPVGSYMLVIKGSQIWYKQFVKQ